MDTQDITPKAMWRRNHGGLLTPWENQSIAWQSSRQRETGVIYMLTGDRHAAQMAVSILSLMDQNQEIKVSIITGDYKAFAIAKEIAEDKRAGIDFVVECEFPMEPRGIQYANKTAMWGLTPYATTLFVDADTLFWDNPLGIFNYPQQRMEGVPHDSVTLTQFADWVSTGKKISGRCEKWRHVVPELVDFQQQHEQPAINTGVIRFTTGPNCQRFFREWRELTLKNVGFICDEIAAQLIFPNHATQVVDHQWNYSPIYSPTAANRAYFTGPKIIHGHGGKFLRKEAGRYYWLPWFHAAQKQNFGQINKWAPAGDDNLAEYLESQKAINQEFLASQDATVREDHKQ